MTEKRIPRPYEERRSDRRSVFLSATLCSGTRAYDVSIRNMSKLGALVHGSQNSAVGDLVTLTRVDLIAHGSIAWSSGSTVAIHFFEAVNAEDWMRLANDRRTERRSHFEAVARK